jgi:predicted nucleotidyltransferase
MSETTRTILALSDLCARRDEILTMAQRYGASNVRVFGSVARNEATSTSNVDLLVAFPVGCKLLGHAALLLDLRDLLRVAVDVSIEANKSHLRSQILEEAVPL